MITNLSNYSQNISPKCPAPQNNMTIKNKKKKNISCSNKNKFEVIESMDDAQPTKIKTVKMHKTEIKIRT